MRKSRKIASGEIYLILDVCGIKPYILIIREQHFELIPQNEQENLGVEKSPLVRAKTMDG